MNTVDLLANCEAALLTEKAIVDIARLMRRLHGTGAERFVVNAILRFEAQDAPGDTAEIWKQVLFVLERTTGSETRGFLALRAERDNGRRFPG